MLWSMPDALKTQDSQRAPMPLILLVEDHAPVREVMSHVLTEEGYSVITAGNGATALDRLEDSTPDLILLDIYLPILDGRRFVQAYRERPGPHAPILVVTGAGYASERAAALDTAGYLSKPFSVYELITKVK